MRLCRQLCGVLLAGTVALPAAQDSTRGPDLATSDLGQGPFSRMHMRLEKTIFGIDVLTVSMRLDTATRDQLKQLAGHRTYSEKLAGDVTSAVLDAGNAIVTLEFERDVALHRWIDGVRSGLSLAAKSGLIARETSDQVSGNLPRWFAPIAERGFQEGDRILYRIYPDRLRTVVVSRNGQVLVDHSDMGGSHGRTVLAGFFAPGTEFRKPLVESLLGS